jgi:hypothetical protein
VLIEVTGTGFRPVVGSCNFVFVKKRTLSGVSGLPISRGTVYCVVSHCSKWT